MEGYLQSGSDNKDLVRFKYSSREDVFDAVSYNKGGRILHMLRNYVGDDAFFKSLNSYLNTNKFKAGEAGQLRLAFEEITGQDMNWFWNQWYYGSGEPKLKIDYLYDDAAGKVIVVVAQTQNTGKVFRLPIAIDIYTGANKIRKKIWIENKIDSFIFSYSKHPDLINVDADKILLCEKVDNKTAQNFIHQYKFAPNYLDRKEALDYFNKNNLPELSLGLKDKFAGLRRQTINRIAKLKLNGEESVIKEIARIAKEDKDKKTQAAAIGFLATTADEQYQPLYAKFLNDSSYSVAGAALQGLTTLDPKKGYDLAKKYSTDAKGLLGQVVSKTMIENGEESDFDFISNLYNQSPASQEKIAATTGFINYLSKVNNLGKIKKGIDYIFKFRNIIPKQYLSFIDPEFKKGFDKLSKEKGSEIESYINNAFK